MAKNTDNDKTTDIVKVAATNIDEVVDNITDDQAVKNFAAGVATGFAVAVTAIKVGADIAKDD
ncbi:MAG: hypothetical protein ACLFVJ_08370 [Persicimonas sp.]